MGASDVVAVVSVALAAIALVVAVAAACYARRSAAEAKRANDLTEQTQHRANAPEFELIKGWFDDETADFTLLLVDAPTRLWVRLDATAEWGTMWLVSDDGQTSTSDIVFDPVLIGGTISARTRVYDPPEPGTETLVMPLTIVAETYEEPPRAWTLNRQEVLRRRPPSGA
jgi:hypothetical protein